MAIWKVTVTMIVPIVFGTMWRMMIRHDAAAHHLDRLHVLARSQAERLAANQARRDQPGDGHQQDDQQRQGGLEHLRHEDEQEDDRDRVADVDEPHQHAVEPPAEEARDRAVDQPERRSRQSPTASPTSIELWPPFISRPRMSKPLNRCRADGCRRARAGDR